jgi:hypothetical protein
MKGIITWVALFLFASSYKGQYDVSLIGTWESVQERAVSGRPGVQTAKLHLSITFYKRHFYRSAEIYDTLLNRIENVSYVGKYRDNGPGQIRFKIKDVLANTSTMTVANTYTVDVSFPNDTTMMLSGKKYFKLREDQFQNMGPEKFFFIQKVQQPDKYVKFRPRETVTLLLEESYQDTNLVYKQIETIGKIESLRRDTVVMNIEKENIAEQSRLEKERWTTNNYRQKMKMIPVHDILYIKLRTPVRKLSYTTSQVLMAAGILAVVISPIAGAGMAPGAKAAAKDRMVTAGLISMGAAVPLFVFGRAKKYHISKLNLTEGKQRWMLRQMFE